MFKNTVTIFLLSVGLVGCATLEERLASTEASVSEHAIDKYRSSTPKKRGAIVQRLILKLNEEDYTSYKNANLALTNIGPEAKAAIPTLGKITRTYNCETKGFELAFQTLCNMGEAATPELVRIFNAKCYNNRGNEVRKRVSEALAEIGVAAVPELLIAMDNADDGGSMIYWVAKTLGGMGTAAQSAIPTLIETLAKTTSSSDRNRIIVSLGDICANTDRCTPALINALDDSISSVRENAITSLKKIGASDVLDVKLKKVQMRASKVLTRGVYKLSKKYPSSRLMAILASSSENPYGISYYEPSWDYRYDNGPIGKVVFGITMKNTEFTRGRAMVGRFVAILNWNINIHTGQIMPDKNVRAWITTGKIAALQGSGTHVSVSSRKKLRTQTSKLNYLAGSEAVIKTKRAKLHARPGIRTKTIAILEGDEVVKVVKRSGNWILVKTQASKTGWLHHSVLRR